MLSQLSMPVTPELTTFAENSLGRYVSAIHLALARELTRQLRQAGVQLTTDQCRVLFHLFFHDGCTQQHLVRLLMQDKSGVSRQLDSLERKGLLTRVPSQQDERQKHLHLTDEGWALLYPCLHCCQKVQEPIFDDFTEEERAQLFALLNKALQALPQ